MSKRIVHNDHYTYIIAYPVEMEEGRVFYVGKGRRERMHQHLWNAKKGIQSGTCDIIRAIWQHGYNPVVSKVDTDLCDADAHILEGRLIAKYDIKTLTNRRYGEGYGGMTTKERRERDDYIQASLASLSGNRF